jgi:hypothetical protein
MKTTLLYLTILFLFLGTSCRLHQIIYPKPIVNCNEFLAPTDTIKKVLEEQFRKKKKYFTYINDTAFNYVNTNIEYSQIKYVKLETKHTITRKTYYIVAFLSLGYHNKKCILTTHDKQIAINACCALQCLANIDLVTNNKAIQSKPDKYDQLKKLKELYKSGTITKEEFESEKAKILAEKN